MSDLKDKWARAVRANLNNVLDRIREFEDRGGLEGVFGEGVPPGEVGPDGFEQIGQGTSGQPRYEQPKSGEKTLREYYANLEVEYGADMDTVKESYRRLMRKYHPDRYTNDPRMERLATELSQELTRAYQAIESYWKTGRY